MLWPFLTIRNQKYYCPLAAFATVTVYEGYEIEGKVVSACPLTAHTRLSNSAKIAGNFVIIERGKIDFVTKVYYAQDAGAKAVIIANANHKNPNESFVMDAGRKCVVSGSVFVPVIMVSTNLAAMIFAEMREHELNRCCAFNLGIQFLGGESALRALDQINFAAVEVGSQNIISREKNIIDAVQLLRNRLGGNIIREELELITCDSSNSLSDTELDLISTSSQTSLLDAKENNPSSTASMSSSSSTKSLQGSDIAKLESVLTLKATCLPSLKNYKTNSLRILSTAVLILDAQNYFCMQENASAISSWLTSPNTYYDRIHNLMLPSISNIIQASRRSSRVNKLIYSVVESVTKDGSERSFAHKHANIHIAKGDYGGLIVPALYPDDNDIVLRRTGINVFESTVLEYCLRNLGVNQLVLTGVSHLSSIQLCARTAIDRGFQVAVICDAITIENSSAEAFNDFCQGLSNVGCNLCWTTDFLNDLNICESTARVAL